MVDVTATSKPLGPKPAYVMLGKLGRREEADDRTMEKDRDETRRVHCYLSFFESNLQLRCVRTPSV